MPLPITVPFTFGNATTTQSLSSLDADFSTVYNAVNGIGNGTVSLSNVSITGGTIANAAITGSVSYPENGYQRNRIINGNMVIDQRNAGASATQTTSVLYTLDRWAVYGTVASKFTAQQNAGSVTTPAGFPNYLGVTSSSAYSVLAADVFWLAQYIEGYNISDLGWGTANAKTVTLSFQVYSSLTGTFGGALRNSATTRSYPFTYSIPTANTWTTISVTIAGDTSGTWVGATNGIGINLSFGLGSGATSSGTAGAWAAASYVSATGATSVVGTSGATFYITGVQLEVGTVATPFERQIYSTQLAQCQRYYQVYTDMMVQGYQGTGATLYNDFPLIVQMRTAPTGAYTGSFSYINASAAAVNSTTGNKYRLSLVVTTTGYGAGYGNPLTFSAEL